MSEDLIHLIHEKTEGLPFEINMEQITTHMNPPIHEKTEELTFGINLEQLSTPVSQMGKIEGLSFEINMDRISTPVNQISHSKTEGLSFEINMGQIATPAKPDPEKRPRYNASSIQKRIELVEKYLQLPEKSPQQRSFAKDNNIKHSTFQTWVKIYKEGGLNHIPNDSERIRLRKSPYDLVSKGLVEYIRLRKKLCCRDENGFSWQLLKDRALKIASKVLSGELLSSFKASDGFIGRVLKSNNLLVTPIQRNNSAIAMPDAETLMQTFRMEVGELSEKCCIPPERIFCVSTFCLFYQKLPTLIFCVPAERENIHGAKQMKDDNCITGVNCTSAVGDKFPLAVVGKEQTSWDICEGQPPLHYVYQKNSRFDVPVFRWWLWEVFIKEYKKRFGEQKGIIILDTKGLEGVGLSDLPPFLFVKGLPTQANLRYQAAVMGIGKRTKLGYKHTLLNHLLSIFDDPLIYAAAKCAGEQHEGCRGVTFGEKPHLLDAAQSLQQVWDSEKYVSRYFILCCWKEAKCLPYPMQADLEAAVGSIDHNTKEIQLDDLNYLVEIMKQLHTKINILGEVPSAVAGSIADPTQGNLSQLTEAQLREGISYWVDVERNPRMIEVEVDEALDAFVEELIKVPTTISVESLAAVQDTTDVPSVSLTTEAAQPSLPQNLNAAQLSESSLNDALLVLMDYSQNSKNEKLQQLCAQVTYEIFLERTKRPRVEVDVPGDRKAKKCKENEKERKIVI